MNKPKLTYYINNKLVGKVKAVLNKLYSNYKDINTFNYELILFYKSANYSFECLFAKLNLNKYQKEIKEIIVNNELECYNLKDIEVVHYLFHEIINFTLEELKNE